MGSNTQALEKSLHAGFVDSLLCEYRGTIAVDKIAAKLRSLKLVIAESLHVVDPVHTMRGPLTERLESVL